ncbi:hypothetical protein JB92DRAFT_3109457 [Gautieria morchelliformis]|nr:hypothetical protein JB92DRAFT_3109457 [Gautieria morchelliformis]
MDTSPSRLVKYSNDSQHGSEDDGRHHSSHFRGGTQISSSTMESSDTNGMTDPPFHTTHTDTTSTESESGRSSATSVVNDLTSQPIPGALLSQLSQLLTAFATTATAGGSSTAQASLSGSPTPSSTTSEALSMTEPMYDESSEKMTTITMTTTITTDMSSSTATMVRTITITSPVPSLTETTVSSSHVNLPATLAPTLGILVLLSLVVGVVFWRRRRTRHVSRGIEGGSNKNRELRDSGLVPLLEEMEQTRHLSSGTKDLPGRGVTWNLTHESTNLRVTPESAAPLSEEPNSVQPPEDTARGDDQISRMSYKDDTVSDISSVEVPFFEHIKAARRAGLLHKPSAPSHQPPVEMIPEHLLDEEET